MNEPRILVARHLDGALSAAEVRTLRTALEADPVLRREAQRQVRMANLLAALAHGGSGQDTARIVADLIAAKTRVSRAFRTGHAVERRIARRRRIRRSVWMALAAGLLVALGLGWLAWSEPAVATLLAARDARIADRELAIGERLARMSVVEVGPAGTATLAIDGARLELDPGTRCVLVDQRAIRLERGTLRADTGDLQARGLHLELRNPQATVISEGTRFAAAVDQEDLHLRLHAGHLRIINRLGSTRLDPGNLLWVSAGQAPGPGLPLDLAQRPGAWRLLPDGRSGAVVGSLRDADGHAVVASRAKPPATTDTSDQEVVVWSGDRQRPLIHSRPGSFVHLRLRSERGGSVHLSVGRVGSSPDDPWGFLGAVELQPGTWRAVTIPLNAAMPLLPGMPADWDGGRIDSLACYGHGTGPFEVEGPAIDRLAGPP